MTTPFPSVENLPELPVREALPNLLAALEDRSRAVLVAPPGAGKTTLVPLALLGRNWRGDGTIVLLEPRRLAARAAARRMAAILGEEVGQTVGYAMRMDNRTGPDTRILVVTEGVFAAMILDDPELTGVAAVLFDEFHERSLDADFGLALALDAAEALRPDLRLVVMSATLDAARVAGLLGDAPIIESKGRAFPVEINYRPRKPDQRIEDAMVAAVRWALTEEEGSIIAFLPGQAEIRRVEERLREAIPSTLAERLDIMPLHGGLQGKDQDAAIRPAPEGRRKIVLATPIAETSVTIDGVRVVIDSGLARVPKYEPGSGVTRLETIRASRASVDQRAGRAGRTQPGVAIRLWAEPQTASLDAHGKPEIMEADLSRLLLDSAAFGVNDPRTLPFLDPPPDPALNEARKLLTMLGALDEAGGITASGHAMRKLALPVRLAFMIAKAVELSEAKRASQLAVLLTERGLGGMASDLERRLSNFERDRSARARSARALADRLAKSAGGGRNATSDMSVGELLLLAYPDRLARRRGGHGRYILANGRGAALDETDPLAGEEWLVVADMTGQARQGRIVAAAALDEVTMRNAMAERIEERVEASFDPESRRLKGRRTTAIGGITLEERTLTIERGPEADAALLSAIREAGLSILPFTEKTESLVARLRWLHDTVGAPWPPMDGAKLLEELDDWLGPFLDGSGRLDPLEAKLADALRSRVPFDLHRRIEEDAPTHFEAPTGNRLPIRYEAERGPVLSIRVQELFGLTDHPTIGGKTPLLLELLSPAHRPIQTTLDLPGFWAGSWSDVRADMRGRYPKHEWPDDPANAEPTARAKRRKV
ncbi:ATP-dependent helicase HrpB [Notoacmeibacter sp. MSK16QG-6]|uniref:ATP-dependent helicase HrpB n=1 Tax=Notoacmeibacter sp. MSK16QG-6 TaxID=2957982 RepID=UPI0020A01B64|nr:ATP-dependent helicase HrpB [Notoacmeibacter sp. MSK16QG-6]MCP1198923.1 ATP-dependent helicase HrpB [Notoacmeibacter sp. MSK16QG-6]